MARLASFLRPGSSGCLAAPPARLPRTPGRSGSLAELLAAVPLGRGEVANILLCVLARSLFVVRMESPCVVLWRPEAFDGRARIPSEGEDLHKCLRILASKLSFQRGSRTVISALSLQQ